MLFITTRSILVTICLQVTIFNLSFGQVKAAKSMENVGEKSQKYTLGIRLGPTATLGHFPKNLPDTILQSHQNKLKAGFIVVGQLTFPLDNGFICLMEGGYARGGRKVNYNIGDSSHWQNDFNYNFLSTSLGLRKTFKIHIKEGLDINLFANIGPNISYLVNGKGGIKTYFKTDEGKTLLGITSPFSLVFHNLEDSIWNRERKENSELDKYHFNHANRFFFGADLGVGGFIPITKRQKLHIELRLTLGQTFIKKRDTKAFLGGVIGGANNNGPTNPAPNIGSFSDPLTTNMRTLNVSVGYTFDFDKKASKQGKSTMDKKRKNTKRR